MITMVAFEFTAMTSRKNTFNGIGFEVIDFDVIVCEEMSSVTTSWC